MGRKTVALSLDEDTYDKYKKFCSEKGIIVSKQVEMFIKKELNENGVK